MPKCTSLYREKDINPHFYIIPPISVNTVVPVIVDDKGAYLCIVCTVFVRVERVWGGKGWRFRSWIGRIRGVKGRLSLLRFGVQKLHLVEKVSSQPSCSDGDIHP